MIILPPRTIKQHAIIDAITPKTEQDLKVLKQVESLDTTLQSKPVIESKPIKPIQTGHPDQLPPVKVVTPEIQHISIPLPSFSSQAQSIPPAPPHQPKPLVEGIVDQSGAPIYLDSYQEKGVTCFREGKAYCILGKAGTGKTTLVQAIALDYLYTYPSHIPSNLVSYRIKGTGERAVAPSMAVIAFTNRAANNIRNKLISHPEVAKSFGYNVTTAHNLLEYSVEFYLDPETGDNKRRYYPKRDATNLLTITHLVIEEATLIGVGDVSIWQQLFDALPPGVQLIFLGDINQLPPVIGKSILNYAVQSLPIVELEQVHRQALENPIIRQALNCIEGKPITEDYNPKTEQGVRVFSGKSKVKLSAVKMEFTFCKLVRKLIEANQFDPNEDMILCPYNTPNVQKPDAKKEKYNLTAQDIAKTIATYLAHSSGSIVYQIKSGYTNLYLRVGERVFIDKQDGIVRGIRTNPGYYGKLPLPASKDLNYEGKHFNEFRSVAAKDDGSDPFEDEYDYSNFSLDDSTDDVEDDKRKRAASHIIEVELDSGPIVFLSSAGQFTDFQLGYALSVHKAQGSEWNRVILVMHDTNATLLFRELLYTAMTRPKIRLDIVCQPHILEKARLNQRIKGKTLADKIEFFNGGYLDQAVQIIPGED